MGRVLPWIMALVFAPVLAGPHDLNNSAPKFDDILVRQIEAVDGQTLILPCTVKNLKDKVVSWIRTKDLHILTSGRHTFSSDYRFESVHSDSSGDFWGLRLRGAKLEDTGQYECQVNTDPKMSLAVGLTVTVAGMPRSAASSSKWIAQSLIKGPTEVRIQLGTTLSLSCEITPLIYGKEIDNIFDNFSKVRWLHNGKEINTDNEYKQITIQDHYDSDSGKRIYSKLQIDYVTWQDYGQYTCMLPSSKPDTVNVVIIEDSSEAMQRDFPNIPDICTRNKATTLCIITFLILYLLLII